MTRDITPDRVVRELRLLKAYAVCSSLVLIALLFTALTPPQEVEVLRAQRVEVVNEDGQYALVLAGRGRLPGPTFGGQEYPQELSGGRVQASGMIFFNESGDEVGGLTYSGRAAGEGYRASGGIMFDQFRQDQVVGLQYSDNGTTRSAGFNVWDRPSDLPIVDIIGLLEARLNATGAARDSIQQQIQAIASQSPSAHRVYLGSTNKTATLVLRDKSGAARIRMYVDSMDVARLEFLDTAGSVLHAFPN